MAGATAAGAVLAAPAIVRAQAKALKVAVVLPRSGLFAAAGQSCHRGAVVAPKVLADLGYAVELINIDFESNVDVARTQTERAIAEGAQAVVGAFESGATLAMAQVCEQRKVPLVINIASVPQLTEQGYQYLVRNFLTNAQLVGNGLKLVKDLMAATNVQFKNAVFVHANDTFGTAQRAAMDKLFPAAQMPFPLVESIAYDPKAQDLAVEVTKIRAVAPELVLVTTRSSDAIKLVRDMVRQRYEPKAIISPGSPGLYDEEFYQALGPLADFHIFNLPWANAKSPVTQALAAAYKTAHPSNRFEVDCFNAGFTFEAIMIAADAFKRAGTADGPTLMKAVKATDIAEHVMTGGPIRFDEKGQNNDIQASVVQNRNRTPTVVLPPEVAVAAPVLPMPPWQGRS
ncbi:ABC transporter substrate-binding protein [Rhodoplanes sp. TEM]|uniref:ABC transporter substrate-binding protein n=1 Tax=Rhodoplanes tepidamans TaxID=200616 RepID=A0ABT5J714_RHOTP|nr:MULTISPECIES: ABC transporter substrate-binding protein [Rhodoplanes]MDC7785462.1 ABC transporter substrate-binding protein [Rhodoplanes tepidamans]MDC7987437.1 ABC transporter substrate-binding protein [Rhodoplanes sp. TEM]MDQ0353368.1 branched-chain amino acid transport system substrate-binding protein [Rhodoplanes tepidamans]